MALQDKYRSYLAHPSEDVLAEDATLNYVPTTTSISSPGSILKHLQTQRVQVGKKGEKFLNVIEGANGICVETETTLHFVQGGGVYLANLDDNFLNDKTVVLPITHIVMFNAEQKIKQIRLLWDQGCLLKGVETIGARGRGWPIRDGAEQVKMIATSAAAGPALAPDAIESAGQRAGRSHTRGVDPHASLALFAPRVTAAREHSHRNSVAPRESAKPAPREWTELFAGEEPIASPERSASPSKRNRENSNPLKAGAGQHYHEPRLFTNDDTSTEAPKEGGIKTSKQKYDHFEFADPVAPPKIADSPAKPRNKHMSQWDFQDFSTPIKPPSRQISHHQPTLKWDEETDEASQREPVFREYVPKPRPDANAHFAFQDEAPKTAPQTQSSYQPPHAGNLYEDHVLGAEATRTDDGHDDRALKNITNFNQHNKTFSSQWEMTDDARSEKSGVTNDENPHVRADSRKPPTTRSQDRHFELFDDSATQEPQRGIKVAGDGMGMRKQAEKHWWEYDEL